MPEADFEGCLARFCQAHPWLPAALARRYLRNYGTRAERLLAGATALEGLGEDFGGGLYAAELDYLARREWAQRPKDGLVRLSTLGLHANHSINTNFHPCFQP